MSAPPFDQRLERFVNQKDLPSGLSVAQLANYLRAHQLSFYSLETPRIGVTTGVWQIDSRNFRVVMIGGTRIEVNFETVYGWTISHPEPTDQATRLERVIEKLAVCASEGGHVTLSQAEAALMTDAVAVTREVWR